MIILDGNPIADGFRMAVSNFLGTRADASSRSGRAATSSCTSSSCPRESARRPARSSAPRASQGGDLERVGDVITCDITLWTDTMMSEELRYGSTERDEFRAGGATLVAFLTIGFLPLLA